VLVRRGRHEPLVDVPAGPIAAVGDEELDLRDDDRAADDAADDVADAADPDAADDLPADDDEVVLADEPLARTLVFLVLGFVVMVAGLASVIAG
jgi:hypothetical protein